MKEKRDGWLKRRICADGCKQRQWITKEDASSPTVLHEAVLLTATIEAKKESDVSTIDILNAFV